MCLAVHCWLANNHFHKGLKFYLISSVQDAAELIERGDFTDLASTGNAPASEAQRWRDLICRLVGLPPGVTLRTRHEESVPSRMLAFRTNKKLMMWDVLVETSRKHKGAGIVEAHLVA